ncbi:probable serine/threonine-protein kinase pats1 [Strongylocentrotus purpuratus]|uniref:COR domain-containing protein n=1 Tax=Strongylocentrotus purpuratus TaxID=7668 RepID=A0A7M7SVM8_STRPU|nr:probable serine/threonine-protein kinase pats1 [Strongylocentrotus purpuratus]
MTSTSSSDDNSTGGFGSDTVQAGEEPPDDEFAGILQQIAYDLYDEAKIDSLAGQLGILHGDIQRALMTNVKFNRVTSDGTHHMLKQWREGVSREDERIELRKALQAAELVNLADLYLSEESGSNQSTLGEGNISGATKTNVMEVAESNIKLLPTSDNKKIAKISQGITREEITKVKSSALDITYSMWDFGGQEIYYITHPLFLSWRSLYILVIPLHLELSDKAPREEDVENAQKQLKGSAVRTHHTILELVHFWLMSVYTYAVPDSHHEPKVLLIGTFAGDEGPEIIGEKVKDKFQELKKQLGSKPYWKQVLFPMCGIDNRFSQGSEVNKIQDRIDGLVKDSAYMKVLMPIKWRTFLTEIEDSDRKTLTVTEAHSTMKTLGINDLKEVYAILKFYHDIGHLIYHEGCELIVLKPQFLNSIVSNIITVMDDKTMEEGLAKYWRDLMEKGILSIELIEAVWEQHKGDHDQLDDIIEMMITFDLICEIPDRPDGRGFFVPCRSSPMLDEKECHDKDNEVKFTIDFNHFLPGWFIFLYLLERAFCLILKSNIVRDNIISYSLCSPDSKRMTKL